MTWLYWIGASSVTLLCALWWRRYVRRAERQRAVSSWREKYQLNQPEVHEITRLSAYFPNVALEDFFARRSTYNHVIEAYVKRLREHEVDRQRFLSTIGVLTRMRVKLHPPAPISRYMSSTRDLVPGLKTIVLFPSGMELMGHLWYVDEDHLLVGLGGDTTAAGIRQGLSVKLCLVVPCQGRYEFVSSVRRVIVGSRPGLLLEHSEERAHPNRREFLREQVKFRISLSFEQTVQGTTVPCEIQGLALDLSAAGIRFLARKPIEVGSDIKVHFPSALIADSELCLVARVTRVQTRDDAGTFIYGAKWVDIRNVVRESIVSYVQDIHRSRPRA